MYSFNLRFLFLFLTEKTFLLNITINIYNIKGIIFIGIYILHVFASILLFK
jgi:hypothetical protein